MTTFSKITWSIADEKLKTQVRSLKGRHWGTRHAPVVALRKRLLTLQGWRCAYCKSHIDMDRRGHRELDHVLPKKATDNCDLVAAASSSAKHRWQTAGYPQFAYEPHNLVIACPECNGYKGSYDSRARRSTSAVRYPGPNGFAWMHPQFHPYSSSIICRNWNYFAKAGSYGDVVIEVCRLNDPEVLERKFAQRARVKVKRFNRLHTAVLSLATEVISGAISSVNAVAAVRAKWDLRAADAKELIECGVELAKDFTESNFVRLKEALAVACTRIRAVPKR